MRCMALLEADVNLKVAKDFINRVKERAIGASRRVSPSQQVIKIVNEELIVAGQPGRSTGAAPDAARDHARRSARLARRRPPLLALMRRDGRRPFMVAGDTIARRRPACDAGRDEHPLPRGGDARFAAGYSRAAEAARKPMTAVLLDTAGACRLTTMMDGWSPSGSAYSPPRSARRRRDDRSGSVASPRASTSAPG